LTISTREANKPTYPPLLSPFSLFIRMTRGGRNPPLVLPLLRGDIVNSGIDVITVAIISPIIIFILKKVFDIDHKVAKIETKLEILLNGKQKEIE